MAGGSSYVQVCYCVVAWELSFNEQQPIGGNKLATYGNGRYVFVLGNKKTDRGERIHYSTFDLECVDLYLSVKTRYNVKGLQDIGYVTGFYALSPTLVVIVDYTESYTNVKQTAVILDSDSYTGQYFIERTYCAATSVAFFFVHCVVGETECVVFAPPNNSRQINGVVPSFCCHLIPKFPWSARSDRSISPFIQIVNAQVQMQLGVAISRWESPQFINTSELAFFLDRGQGICPDPLTIVIVNITPDPRTGFPKDAYCQMPIDSKALHTPSGQITLLTTYARPAESYQAHLARLLQHLCRHVWQAFYFTAENCNWLAPMFLHIALGITSVRSKLMYNPAAKTEAGNLSSMAY
ncbi:unnamed protein product [Nippostrongylus brasiliensis]|uniref:CUB domain-containing protein n=1 Tax=Nippostrongylus brasiliensis TaxID=27835 RepID=A0A158QZA1_NIPBR|nr:unnamed protein product [Nippostrongylus brasiliensis]